MVQTPVDWSRFDRVFVQCFTGYALERQAALDAELERVGLWMAERHWACPNPFDDLLADRVGYYKPKAVGGFQCVLGHYQIIKTAYERGFAHILVLEDDVRFLKDLDALGRAIESLPADYDVAKLEWSRASNVDQQQDEPKDGMWFRSNGVVLYGAAATAYSRKGMATVIERIEALVSSGRPLRNIDDLGLYEEVSLVQYACKPVAAIQSAAFSSIFGNPRDYAAGLSGDTRTAYGNGETAGLALVDLHDADQLRDFDDLLRLAWRGKPIRMLEIGSYRGESAKAFVSSGLVETLYCVDPWVGGWDPDDWLSEHDMAAAEADFDKVAAADRRIVKCKGTVDDFVRAHPDERIDFVYIDASKRYEDARHILEVVRDTIRPTLGISGRDFMYRCGVRDAVLDTLGFPFQVLNDTSWFFPADGGKVPEGETRYWRFLGGRLGNQLYYLVQVHRMGRGNVYAGAGTTMQQSFQRLGGTDIVVDCDKRKYPTLRASGQHWKMGIHYTLDDIKSFVREVVLPTRLVREAVSRYGLNKTAVAMHVRNTDFIDHAAWGLLDRDRYVPDAIETMRKVLGVPQRFKELHVFSDDNAETQRRFGKVLAAAFAKVVYMDARTPEEDMVRLATYKAKILFNSTFSTWAGYIGDGLFGSEHRVVIPSVFYARERYIEPMSTLANPKWHQVVAHLKDGRVCKVIRWSRIESAPEPPKPQEPKPAEAQEAEFYGEWTHL